MNLVRSVRVGGSPLPACGESVGRLWRPFLRTPKRSFGYVASLDAMRVRGILHEVGARDCPSPQPSPRKHGERERTSAVAAIEPNFITLLGARGAANVSATPSARRWRPD